MLTIATNILCVITCIFGIIAIIMVTVMLITEIIEPFVSEMRYEIKKKRLDSKRR